MAESVHCRPRRRLYECACKPSLFQSECVAPHALCSLCLVQTRDEVRVLSSLQHPNIVLYQEGWQEQGFQYIAMEFCEVGPLHCCWLAGGSC